jgi:hypothetical protein
MAIQLNDRDHMIFNLIEEHEVLLEKHIAWFISADSKPVLIRDRLRKLFYLDYLLCQRHSDTLPWWTTPTKPLVYSLSPMSRTIVGSEDEFAMVENETRRHLLEVANLRMLFMIDEKEGRIEDLCWTTLKEHDSLAAKVTFKHNGLRYSIGIINNPTGDAVQLAEAVHRACESADVDKVWIVSRDEESQKCVQTALKACDTEDILDGKCVFATHQHLYKAGMVKAKWQNGQSRQISMFVDSISGSQTMGSMVSQAC